MTVDDVVEAIFRRLCLRQRHQGVGAAMSLTELQIGLGVTEEQLGDAVTVAGSPTTSSSPSLRRTG